MSDAIESTGTEVVVGSAVPAEVTPANLFRTSDPADVLRRARDTAEALMPVVREQGLVANIQGKDHLTVEAWQTLGAMLGVTPVCVWTREVEKGWEARVEARTLDGRVVGASESECLRDESRWASADDYAIRSMAQTRATSKALASVLRFVATLAGFQGTPAEEMPREPRRQGGGGNQPSPAQRRAISAILNKHAVPKDFQAAIVKAVGGDPLTKSGASKVLDILKDDDHTPERNVERLVEASGLPWPSDTPADDGPGPDEVDAEGDYAEEVSF